jgi:hypothetical protein
MRSMLLFIMLFGSTFLGSAGGTDVVMARESNTPEIVLHLRPPMVTGASIKLPYEIPYPGYIEFYLFDSEKKKIWQDFGVKEKGEHAQSLKSDKFDKGKTYFYEFWYKGKPYPGKFSF